MFVAPLLVAASITLGSVDPAWTVRNALAAGHVSDAVAAVPAALDAIAAGEPAAAAAARDDLGVAVAEAAGGDDAAVRAAADCFRRALDLRTRAFGESHPETARSWSTLSDFAFTLGKWDEAEADERRALAIRRSALPDGDLATAGSLDSLGIVLLRQGRLAEAEGCLSEAERIRAGARQADPAKLAETRNALAECYRQQDRLDESEQVFRRAIADARALGPDGDDVVSRLENNLAGLLKDRGRWADAEELVRGSLARRERAGPDAAAALSVGTLNLAEIYRLEGNVADAEPLYRRSLDLARRALGPDNPDLATHLGQLAVLYRDTARPDEAIPLFDEAAALLERTVGPGHPLLAQVLDDRARLEDGAGRPAVAEALFRRALAIREAVFGPDQFDSASTRVALAGVEARRGPEGRRRAERDLGRAIASLDRSAAYPDVAAEARSRRAALRRARGDLEGASADLEAAATTIENLRPAAGGGEATRAAFLARHHDVFASLVDLLATRGRAAEAFAWSERARARTFLDQLGAARVDVRSGIPAERRAGLDRRDAAARARFAEAQARAGAVFTRTDLDAAVLKVLLARARRETAEAAAELRRLHEETLNASPLWRSASGGEVVSAHDAARLPARGEVLFAYTVGADTSWLFVVRPAPAPIEARRLTVATTTAKVLGIAPGSFGAGALSRVLDGPGGLVVRLSRPPAPGFEEDPTGDLAALFDVLVPTAVRPVWRAAQAIVVVPDGALSRFPFESLVTRAAGTDAPRFWLDEGPQVRYAPSATALRALAAQGTVRGDGGLVTVSDPDYARSGPTRWTALPGTARESSAVVEAFRSHGVDLPVTALTGALADEPHVRAALTGHRLVHLAVHGIVDAGRGDLLAALALAPPAAPPRGTDDDGLLHLFELYEMDLTCDIAVLSACGTGAGEAVAGEGVFALARGFLARGARRVVATHWQVDDASAATVVAALFDAVAAELAAGREPDYAAALAAAKRRVRDDPATGAPFHWAPFFLTGLR